VGRRIVLLALVAALAVVTSGVAAWRHHVDALAALIDGQLATAQAFTGAQDMQRDPQRLLRLLARPDVTVIIRDDASGTTYAYIDGIAAPAGQGGGPGSPPGPPPPGAGFAPPGPQPPGPAPQRRSTRPLAFWVASLARIAPRQTDAGDLSVTLLAAAGALMRWFFIDVIICALAIAGIAVAAYAIVGAFARSARAPMLRTTAALEGLAAGNFTPQSIEAGDSPEIARLARAYNAAAETVARSIEERRAAAAEFQRFLADAGHELRTPLTIVGGYIDILGRDVDTGNATGRRAIAGMSAETARMRALVEKMLLLSRLETVAAAPEVVAVATVSDEVAEAMRPGFPGRSILVTCDPQARIRIDEDDLYEAERNLVENALRYAPESLVAVRASVRDGAVDIEVADRGPGIPEAERAMIFERFYRGKDRTDSQGSGLGLAIVRRVVERWGGTLSLNTDRGETRFVMRFPAARDTA
jgi:two-component system OmpR family sensor kinase